MPDRAEKTGESGQSAESPSSDESNNLDWLDTAPSLESEGESHTLDFDSPLLATPKDTGRADDDFDFDQLLNHGEQENREKDASPKRDNKSRSKKKRGNRRASKATSPNDHFFDDETIPLEEPDSQSSDGQLGPPRKCPSCNMELKPDTVVCINCGYNLEEGGKIKTKVIAPSAEMKSKRAPDDLSIPFDDGEKIVTPKRSVVRPEEDDSAAARRYKSKVADALRKREDDDRGSKFLDLILPLIFLVAGGVFIFIGGMQQDWSVAKSIAAIGTDLLVKVPLLVFAVFMTARLMDISYGPMGKALFKLAAIGIGPLALTDYLVLLIAVATLGTGMLFGVFIYIILAGIPLWLMFNLDYRDTMLTLLAIGLVRFLYPWVQDFLLMGFR